MHYNVLYRSTINTHFSVMQNTSNGQCAKLCYCLILSLRKHIYFEKCACLQAHFSIISCVSNHASMHHIYDATKSPCNWHTICACSRI